MRNKPMRLWMVHLSPSQSCCGSFCSHHCHYQYHLVHLYVFNLSFKVNFTQFSAKSVGRRACTVRGPVGCSHQHHSALKERPEQLLQDHGIGDIAHLMEEKKQKRRSAVIPACHSTGVLLRSNPAVATPWWLVSPGCAHSLLCIWSWPHARTNMRTAKPLELTVNGHEGEGEKVRGGGSSS